MDRLYIRGYFLKTWILKAAIDHATTGQAARKQLDEELEFYATLESPATPVPRHDRQVLYLKFLEVESCVGLYKFSIDKFLGELFFD